MRSNQVTPQHASYKPRRSDQWNSSKYNSRRSNQWNSSSTVESGREQPTGPPNELNQLISMLRDQDAMLTAFAQHVQRQMNHMRDVLHDVHFAKHRLQHCLSCIESDMCAAGTPFDDQAFGKADTGNGMGKCQSRGPCANAPKQQTLQDCSCKCKCLGT